MISVNVQGTSVLKEIANYLRKATIRERSLKIFNSIW
jgi:hypothetical protein